MCGVAGVVGTARELPRAAVEQALVAIRHRGPDAAGVRAYRGRRSAVLGATRLRVRDLSVGADQPMANEEDTTCLVYNGELYNADELRADLEQAGCRFRTRSDTECVLHLYDHLDGDVNELLGRLRGMFALAVWDDRRGRLLLARDRLGIKPMAWAPTGDGLAFASEARALVDTGLAPRRLDRAALGSYLAWGSIPHPVTMFEGVSRLCPGELLVWEGGDPVVHRWWQPTLGRPLVTSREEAVALVETAVEDAVTRHLVADRTVGLFLSGGTDSGAVAAVAARSGRVDAVTAAFPEERGLDEGAAAAAVADRLGLRHVTVPVVGADVVAMLPGFVEGLDQPSADAINSWVVCKAATDAGLVVALSGVGGDELFAGYPSFQLVPRVRSLARLLQMTPDPVRRRVARYLVRGHPAARAVRLLSAQPTTPSAYQAVRGMFAGIEVDALGLSPSSPARPVPSAHEAVDAITALELDTYLANQLLPDLDSVSMAHSLEVRVPLLDDVVVASALAVPAAHRLGGKQLLADAVGIVRQSPKQPFTMPFEQWMRGPLRATVEEALRSERLPFAAELPSSFRDGLWTAFEQRRVHWSRTWAIAMVRLWGADNDLG